MATSGHMTSRQWRDHFRQNLQKRRIDWQQSATVDREADRKLVRSLQAWQRGETSDGSNLLRAARKYAERCGDPEYLDAITLFIKEEQKHGENLGRYLDTIEADRIQFDVVLNHAFCGRPTRRYSRRQITKVRRTMKTTRVTSIDSRVGTA